jgi:pyridoxal phosphate enzyme (YggS family)
VSEIAENLAAVRERIGAACERAGRPASEVRLVAASKTVEPARLAQAVAAGQTLFGENYVQEARRKVEALPGATWHLIGHLQSNKAAQAVGLFDLIHSVDSGHLAAALDRRAGVLGKRQGVLIEVNLAGEASKTGVAEAEAAELVQLAASLPHLDLLGLMTMPPFFDEPERARPYFARLRELRERLREVTGLPLPELSMGMSGDYEVAIEEGATLVRVGTAVFGRRD